MASMLPTGFTVTTMLNDAGDIIAWAAPVVTIVVGVGFGVWAFKQLPRLFKKARG